MIRLFLAVFLLACAPIVAAAQNTVWVQVEAQRNLQEAQDRARVYASQLENVAGYAVGGGWYGIVLGPYGRADADTLLNQLKRNRQIPGDSFINFGNNLGQQIWPIGTGAANTAQPLPGTEAGDSTATEEAAAPEPVEVPVIQPADERPRHTPFNG